MNKKVLITGIVMILGAALLGLAFAIPALKTSASGVIGGADLPTFLFHFRETAWIAAVGLIMVIVCMFIRHKK